MPGMGVGAEAQGFWRFPRELGAWVVWGKQQNRGDLVRQYVPGVGHRSARPLCPGQAPHPAHHTNMVQYIISSNKLVSGRRAGGWWTVRGLRREAPSHPLTPFSGLQLLGPLCGSEGSSSEITGSFTHCTYMYRGVRSPAR